MPKQKNSPHFDAYYYAHDCGEPYERNEFWLELFDRIAEGIIQRINPQTVLDAGCAWGFLVEALRKRGVDAWGVDISSYAISQVEESVRPYCRLGSLTEPLEREYDLIVNIEVLEHMTNAEARQAVANMCSFTQDIVFSSTPFDYSEATHINVQPPEFWAHLFALEGFYRDFDFDGSFITTWTTRFRQQKNQIPGIVRKYERQFFYLWKENQDMRKHLLTQQKQIAKLDAFRQELDEVYNSNAWQFVSGLQRFRLKIAPPGSWRERVFKRLLRVKKREDK
jgi:hypothetical protein